MSDAKVTEAVEPIDEIICIDTDDAEAVLPIRSDGENFVSNQDENDRKQGAHETDLLVTNDINPDCTESSLTETLNKLDRFRQNDVLPRTVSRCCLIILS